MFSDKLKLNLQQEEESKKAMAIAQLRYEEVCSRRYNIKMMSEEDLAATLRENQELSFRYQDAERKVTELCSTVAELERQLDAKTQELIAKRKAL